jgi:hypothetical protein
MHLSFLSVVLRDFLPWDRFWSRIWKNDAGVLGKAKIVTSLG